VYKLIHLDKLSKAGHVCNLPTSYAGASEAIYEWGGTYGERGSASL